MFTEAPRYFGYPTQNYVTSEQGLLNLIKEINGKGPCFVSEYVYPKRFRLRFDKVFFDFDSKDGLRGPHNSCNRLLRFCESLNIPTTIDFSGSKGYHLHMAIKASKVTARELWALHCSLTSHLGLDYADKHSFGVLRQIVRVPTTLHVDKFGVKNGRYCRYLTKREFEKGVQHSVHLAKTPGILPENLKSDITFGELASFVPNYLKVYEQNNGFEQSNVKIERTREEISSVNVVAPVCLNVGIQDWNPTHITRFETTAWCKFIGFSNAAILDLYSRLGWRDFGEGCTKYQISRIRPRLPVCAKLKVVTDSKYCGSCPLERGDVV